MRALVILVAVSCCSAQVIPYAAPWSLSPGNLIDAGGNTVGIATPYSGIFSPYNPFPTPYATPYSYMVRPNPDFKYTEFPFIWQESEPAAEAEAAPAVEEARRRRRDVETVKMPLPYLQAMPAVAKTTYKTKQYEPVEAAVPADTTKLEIITKEHELTLPAVKYTQPFVEYKPITYKVPTPTPLSYTIPAQPYSYFPYTYPYGIPAAPVMKLEE